MCVAAVLQARTPTSFGVNMRACSMPLEAKRHSSKKASGSAKNGRDGNPNYLGVKLYGKYVFCLCKTDLGKLSDLFYY